MPMKKELVFSLAQRRVSKAEMEGSFLEEVGMWGWEVGQGRQGDLPGMDSEEPRGDVEGKLTRSQDLNLRVMELCEHIPADPSLLVTKPYA